MPTKSLNSNLHKANQAKKDEFYTQLIDIEKELKHYKEQFRGKVIYCNCDDPFESNFFKYFASNFNALGLKKLITTSYSGSPIVGGQLPLFEMAGSKGKQPLKIGDFRSEECIKLLKEADIVVTNPPFSLFREYVAQLMENKKKFLILGDQNAITYKETFGYIKDDKLWVGYDNGGTKWFQVPMDYDISTESRKKIVNGVKYFSMGRILWFTNLDTTKRHEELTLYKKYSPKEYSKFDYYNAINVNRYIDIPMDYNGAMGVPITFIDKYNPAQFEIISSNDIRLNDNVPYKEHGLIKDKDGAINGKPTYVRIVIKNKKVKK